MRAVTPTSSWSAVLLDSRPREADVWDELIQDTQRFRLNFVLKIASELIFGA